MFNAPSFSPRSQPKSRVYDTFRLGVCVLGDPTEIKQLRDCQNAVMDRFGFQRRAGLTKKGTAIGTVKVTGLQELIIGVKTYFLAVCGLILKKWCLTDSDTDWSNTDKINLTTTLNSYMRSFSFIDGSAVETGTSTGTNNTSRVLYDTGKAWTADAYLGKILQITGGTGSGQKKLIIANDPTKIYVNEPFTVVPDATSTYSIFTPLTQACLANGTDTFFKYNGTASSNITTPNSVKFADVEVHNKRLWGISGDYVYFSDEAVGDQFSQDSVVPFKNGDGNLLRIQALNEQLVAYKRNSFAVINGADGNYGIKTRVRA